MLLDLALDAGDVAALLVVSLLDDDVLVAAPTRSAVRIAVRYALPRSPVGLRTQSPS